MHEGRASIKALITTVKDLEFERVGDLVGRGSTASGVYEVTGFGGSTMIESFVVVDGQLLYVLDAAAP
ncbi:MAG TPA: hypothetical protein VLA90_11765 [Actinomycetota bacterium]|nr:hypothetical protein [Actinomycetota bacterium]